MERVEEQMIDLAAVIRRLELELAGKLERTGLGQYRLAGRDII